LMWKDSTLAIPALEKVVLGSKRPETRLQALCTLDGLGKLNTVGLLDDHPGVRRHSIRVAEKYFGKGESIGGGALEEHVLAALVTNYNKDGQLRLQEGYTLGAWKG